MWFALALAAFAADARWHLDGDNDGDGDPERYTIAPAAPPGYVGNDDDCDDADPRRHTGATETCDAVDEDCDGDVDSEKLCGYPVYQREGHGYLLAAVEATWVEARAFCADYGYNLVTVASDAEDDWLDRRVDAISTDKWWLGYNDIEREGQWVWQDGSVTVYTNWYTGEPNDGLGGGTEDCALLNRFHPIRAWNDEPCANTFQIACESAKAAYLYEDADGDGHGDLGGDTTFASDELDGYAFDADDCDDNDPSAFPGAAEVWYDGVDQDCDGHSDHDADFDGEDAPSGGGKDCDDADSQVHPGAAEVASDGVDQDCDGDDLDADGDGALAPGDGGEDCDDTDPGVYPGAPEVDGDGLDQDCDGYDGGDTDGDGLTDRDEGEIYGTKPRKADTDGDGINDGDEVAAGTDPLDPDDPAPGDDDAEPPEALTPSGCGCAGGPHVGGGWVLGLLGVACRRRRRGACGDSW